MQSLSQNISENLNLQKDYQKITSQCRYHTEKQKSIISTISSAQQILKFEIGTFMHPPLLKESYISCKLKFNEANGTRIVYDKCYSLFSGARAYTGSTQDLYDVKQGIHQIAYLNKKLNGQQQLQSDDEHFFTTRPIKQQAPLNTSTAAQNFTYDQDVYDQNSHNQLGIITTSVDGEMNFRFKLSELMGFFEQDQFFITTDSKLNIELYLRPKNEFLQKGASLDALVPLTQQIECSFKLEVLQSYDQDINRSLQMQVKEGQISPYVYIQSDQESYQENDLQQIELSDKATLADGDKINKMFFALQDDVFKDMALRFKENGNRFGFPDSVLKQRYLKIREQYRVQETDSKTSVQDVFSYRQLQQTPFIHYFMSDDKKDPLAGLEIGYMPDLTYDINFQFETVDPKKNISINIFIFGVHFLAQSQNKLTSKSVYNNVNPRAEQQY